jgi:hypothetical protein
MNKIIPMLLIVGFSQLATLSAYEIIVDKTTRFDTKKFNIKNKPLERDSVKEVVTDPNTKLMWQDNASVKTTKKDWQGALKYCKNLKFAGFSGWRLPSIDELLSITDDTKYNPAIKDGFSNVTADVYWSSSPKGSDSILAWYVDFERGNNSWYGKSLSGLVRCVRDN